MLPPAHELAVPPWLGKQATLGGPRHPWLGKRNLPQLLCPAVAVRGHARELCGRCHGQIPRWDWWRGEGAEPLELFLTMPPAPCSCNRVHVAMHAEQRNHAVGRDMSDSASHHSAPEQRQLPLGDL